MTVHNEDVQGLVAAGYVKETHMRALVLRVTDAGPARAWLAGLEQHLTWVGDRDGDKANVAFTHAGLEALGCRLSGWEFAFVEGITTPRRSRILGDLGDSAPGRWEWGGPENRPVHAVLLLYSKGREALGAFEARTTHGMAGIEAVTRLDSVPLAEGKEHFGFRDGLSNPTADEIRKGKDAVRAGEFVLGLPDESGTTEPAPPEAEGSSMLVFRQLEQDVPGFWDWLRRQPGDPVDLASRFVGRMPDGRPLAVGAGREDEAFDFRRDKLGRGCPLGAHVRRAHPRDSFGRPDTGRHRLLRRGRPWGTPAPPETWPDGGMAVRAAGEHEPTDRRGLHFLCLQASLSRQFEFVQQTWLNNPKFLGLSQESDVFASSRVPAADVFTVPEDPIRRRLHGVPTFVRTLGGAYFVLPGRRLFRLLAGA